MKEVLIALNVVTALISCARAAQPNRAIPLYIADIVIAVLSMYIAVINAKGLQP